MKKYIAENGGKVVGEEYVPFGAPNKFEEAVTRIKSAKPDAVLITLVGADNVNFNRTFAGFGLDKDIARLSLLLEENTLKGIGADSSSNLYSCMSISPTPERGGKKFKAAYIAKFGDKAPQLAIDRRRLLCGCELAHRRWSTRPAARDAKKCMAASEGLTFATASGRVTMHGRHVDKNMYLADCKGTEFKIIKTFARRQERRRAARPDVESAAACCAGSVNGPAARHPGDQPRLRGRHTGGSRARPRGHLRPARRAQHRARRIRDDRRLLRLRRAGGRLAVSCRGAARLGRLRRPRLGGRALVWSGPLYRRPFDTLVATWGLSLLLRKSAEAIFGLGYKSLECRLAGRSSLLGTEYPSYRLLLIGVIACVVVGLVLWYGKSRTGTRIQAMVGNPELAQALGIPVARLAAGDVHRRHLPGRPWRRHDRAACVRCSRSWGSITC